MTLDGTAGITFPSTTVQGDAGTGYGQLWRSTTIAFGTTFTNSTGQPIAITFRIGTAGTSTVTPTVNGVALPATTSYANQTNSGFLIVPNGATYSFAGSNLGGFSTVAVLD
jgi:hypothetical protein